MLMKSKKMFWQTLLCSTFISTSTLIMSNNAYAEEEKASEVNQQLLMPNESVDDMTDINRTRRYYQARESRNEAQTEEVADTSAEDITEEEIKLPPRTKKKCTKCTYFSC